MIRQLVAAGAVVLVMACGSESHNSTPPARVLPFCENIGLVTSNNSNTGKYLVEKSVLMDPKKFGENISANTNYITRVNGVVFETCKDQGAELVFYAPVPLAERDSLKQKISNASPFIFNGQRQKESFFFDDLPPQGKFWDEPTISFQNSRNEPMLENLVITEVQSYFNQTYSEGLSTIKSLNFTYFSSIQLSTQYAASMTYNPLPQRPILKASYLFLLKP